MSKKIRNIEKKVGVSESALLSLVSNKLKGKVLFQKKLEEAKKTCEKLV